MHSGVGDWITRAERASDVEAVRSVNLAAFPTPAEADLVDALRQDSSAWIDGLSVVTVDADDSVVGHALLTRCLVGGEQALALAPCAVLPDRQRTGAGSAAIRTALAAAKALGENLVVVLGHPEYYPRFGFQPASRIAVTAPFDVPDDAFLTLALDSTRTPPQGSVTYAVAFGV